jgi:twinkle protein|tara:strand:+ start:2573 stop:3487 length:915 start_codon:yes stop_codon:yes gene_type:complete
MSEPNINEMMSQLTITKDTLQKGGYYEEETDFKVKSTDTLLPDVINYFKEEKGAGFSLGLQKTDQDYNFLIRKGEVTILTGSSGSGKTTFLSQVLLNLMDYTNVLVASMEMKPVLQIAKMIQQTGLSNPTTQGIEEFCDKYKDKLWLFNAQGTTTENDLVASLNYGKHILNVDVFVIDSLMKVDSIAEDDYGSQKKFINKISCIARDLNIHVFIVAHTKKLSDDTVIPDASHILGSSHIRNLTDNILCLHRRKDIEKKIELKELEEGDNPCTCYLMVQKQRNHSFEGTFGLWFNKESQRFKERP